MRSQGKVAGAIVAAMLTVPTTAGAQSSVDPAVQASLRFAADVGYGPASGRPAGDVNGDGQDDVLAVQDHQVTSGEFATDSTIYFGRLPAGTTVFGTPGVQSAQVSTEDSADARPAGDLNGDGRDDLVADLGTTRFPGGTFAYYGAPGFTSPVRAFEVVGADAGSVREAGDVNGDGFADLLARRGDRVLVVLGSAAGVDVDVSGPGAWGFEVLGVAADTPVAAAGDVNGDGRNDVLVGGRVLLGRAATTDVDPATPGASLVAASGDVEDVDRAGDVNGDGLDDVILLTGPRQARVAFGRATPGPLSAGFTITSGEGAIGPAGDVDGDGYDDVLAFGAVVFGKARPSGVNAAAPRTKGFRYETSQIDREDLFAASTGPEPIAGVGDVTGDGRDDVMVANYLVSGGTGPAGSECTITGTEGDDVLTGTDGPDVICALAGRDRVRGLGGDDRIFGGRGLDELDGGLGNDVLAGEDLHDRLIGDAGNDRMTGNDGRDFLEGGDGEDRMAGGVGDDRLFGHGHHDTLDGQQGRDGLDGAEEWDLLLGGAHDDDLSGGAGDDQIGPGTGYDEADGGLGPDLIEDPDGMSAFGDDGDDTITAGGGELKGGDGDDTIQALASAFMLGGSGDDSMFGGPLSEYIHAERHGLFGGSGDDLIVGGGGDDSLFGENGDDRLIDGGEDTAGRDFDALIGGTGDDELTDGSGRDQHHGGGGQDTLIGGPGRDVMSGGAAGDTITAGPDGGDKLIGQTGDDTLDSRNGAVDANICNPGFDTVLFDAVDAVAADCEVLNP